MKWIQEHLNIPTLQRKPHRWTLAALLSPIIFGATLYKKKYHLQYVHAKKLFVFDILLLLGTLLLICTTYFWHTYDPTITDFIILNIEVHDESNEPIDKIVSGDVISYTIYYENTSDVLLTSPELRIELPEFFQITQIEADNEYNPLTNTIALPDVLSHSTGTIQIDGRYFGIPEESEPVTVSLTYIQDNRTRTETRHAQIISTLRGSLLTVETALPSQMLGSDTAPITLRLTNTSDITLTQISLPRFPAPGVSILPEQRFITTNDAILIDTIAPEETIVVSGSIKTSIDRSIASIHIPITPGIRILDTVVPQTTQSHTISLLHPAATVSLAWDQTVASPGDNVTARVTLTNTGNETLQEPTILLPSLSNIVDLNRLTLPIKNGSIVLDSSNFDELTALHPGSTITLQATLPIHYRPTGGTDILFALQPTLISTVGTNHSFEQTGSGNTLSIGSALFGSSHAIYYTPEGDQLGRGPLPPTVDDETKYLSVITIENTSSRLRNLSLSGTLPPGVRFTGKTSVTAGNDITYSEANNSINWDTFSLPAYQTVGLYIELGITPTSAMIGTTPPLLRGITLQATDSHTGLVRNISIADITTALGADVIGKSKGDTVIN